MRYYTQTPETQRMITTVFCPMAKSLAATAAGKALTFGFYYKNVKQIYGFYPAAASTARLMRSSASSSMSRGQPKLRRT